MIIRRATIRLTIQYSLVMLGIIALFAVGVVVYATVAFDLELPESSEGSVDQANATLRMSLIVCFAVLVLIVPPLSYLLARRTLAPVRANLEAQQRFVDDASHEFRTPIAVAQGELELALLHPRRPEEYRAAMRAALAALDELGSLTGDLLLLAREDGIEVVAEHIDIEALGERLPDMCPASTRDRLRLRVVGAGGFQGVPELVTRAAMNLVENAAKFSPEDAPIDVLIERSGDRVRIVVTDQGHGMSPEQAARAFDRFWRADTARSSPGRGIGLSIVRRIAELHGGRAILHSTPGAGTSATLELPASPAS